MKIRLVPGYEEKDIETLTELPQVCTFGEPHFISFAFFLHKVRKVGLAKPTCSYRAVHKYAILPRSKL